MFVCSSPVQLRLFRIIIRRRPPSPAAPGSTPHPRSQNPLPLVGLPLLPLPVSVAVIVVVIVAGAGGDWFLLGEKESLQRKELLCIYYDYYAVYSSTCNSAELLRLRILTEWVDALYNV